MTDLPLFTIPKPDLPGKVHGIVSLDPPQVQCDGCGFIAEGEPGKLNLLILTCGINFNTRGGEGWQTRRLCRDCDGEPRTITPSVAVRAVGRFRPDGPTGYRAVEPWAVNAPVRPTRDEALGDIT